MAARVDERYCWYCPDCGDGSVEFYDYRSDAQDAADRHNRDNEHATAESRTDVTNRGHR